MRLELVEVQYRDGPADTYALVRTGDALDALTRPEVGAALLRQMYQAAARPTERGGALVSSPTGVLEAVAPSVTGPPRVLGGEQSNTSIRYGEALILKLFRRLQPGANPEVEVGRFLTERTGFRNAPAVAATLEYSSPDGVPFALAILQTYVPNRGDAWSTTLERLRRGLDGAPLPAAVEPLRRLAEVTAELHLALGSVEDDPAFAPRPIVEGDLAAWVAAIDAEIGLAAAELRTRGREIDAARPRPRARGLSALLGSLKIRHHGDYHLGQVLERGDGDFAVIDFEGEPLKPLAARRAHGSALRDVASMLRSFDYARHAALRAGDAGDPARAARADAWYAAVRQAFLEAYLARVRAARPPLLPGSRAAVDRVLGAFELEKAAYEVRYELSHRPDWLGIPLAAFAGAG